MAEISPRITSVIGDFATSLGLSATPARDGSYSFAFEHNGRLTFAPTQESANALMSLTWHVSRMEPGIQMRFFRLAGLDPTTATHFHTGMTRTEDFVLAIRLHEENFNLPLLDHWLNRLFEIRSAFP